MKKQQVILVSGSLIAFILLFFFGKTIPPKSNVPVKPAAATAAPATPVLATADVIGKAKKGLSQQQLTRILQLENSVVRGDVKAQQIKVFRQLAGFWGDTARQPAIGAFYLGEAAKLENNEKNLTFAAHLLLDNLMAERDAALVTWQATQAKALFERGLEINPANDSSKVGIGACYLFGNISPMPMVGIQKVMEVANRDTNNMYAQMVLGMGGVKSGQLDKAIDRFLIVVKKQPANLEAVFSLADAYDRKGDKQNAIMWYKAAKEMVAIPEAKNEIDNRIKALQ